MFVDELYFDDSVFFCDFDSSFPDHVFPIVEVIAFGGGDGWHFEDGDSFGFVAEY